MAAIRFLDDDSGFKLRNTRRIASWLVNVAKNEGFTVDSLAYVFCSDKTLLSMNKKFLSHDSYTDIITFDLSDGIERKICGEIYISIQRVLENADKFGCVFNEELHRVLVHGVLHLIGYNDKSPREKARMRKKEEACLSLL